MNPRDFSWRAAARKAGPPLALALLTFCVFCPVLRNQFVPFWDDNDKLLENPSYHPARLANLAHYWTSGPHHTFYVPVTYSVYGLLVMAAGFKPAVFHAANLLCQMISAVLVFAILKHLVRSTRAAWIGAALFAIHPLQTEPVAWIGTLYTPLSGMFALLAIRQYLQFDHVAQPGPAADDVAQPPPAVVGHVAQPPSAVFDRRSKRTVPGKKTFACGGSQPGAAVPHSTSRTLLHYALGTVAFILALLAKPSAVVVPVMLAAILLGLYRRRIRGLLAPLGLWGALCVPIVVINRLAYPGNAIFAPLPWQRVVVALDTIAFYLYKLAAPFRMVPDYGRSPRWVVDHPMVWLTCLVPIAIFIVCRLLRRRVPWLGVCAAVFVAGLVPVLGLTPFDFQIYSTPADRYVSLSLLGVAMAAAFLLARFTAKLPAVLALVVLCALAVRSFDQTSIWQDQWRLFATTLEVTPQSRAAAAAFRYLLITQPDAAAAQTCTLSGRELARVADLLLSQRHSDLAADAYELAIARGDNTAAIYGRLASAYTQTAEPQKARQATEKAREIRLR